MITDRNAKRWQTWGNGTNMKRGLVDVGLHVEQKLLNRPGGQMLGVNFLSHSSCDTWPTVGVMWHTLQVAARTLENGMTEQMFQRDC